VEALESDNTPRKWTRDELQPSSTEYTAKLKALKAEHKTPSPNSGAQLGACAI
jgi:hypothetical protein